MLKKLNRLLSASESKETFFKRIEKLYSKYTKEYRYIERAYDDAEEAFRDKLRDGGEEYFSHLRAVAIILIDYLYVFERKDLNIPAYQIIAAALLHDMVEDCPKWTLDKILRDYGRDVALLLDYVSKRPKSQFKNVSEQRKFYHDRFITAPIEFFLIKLADRLHNQMTLWCCDKEKVSFKIYETKEYYIPWAKKWGILAHELEETVIALEANLEEYFKNCLLEAKKKKK